MVEKIFYFKIKGIKCEKCINEIYSDLKQNEELNHIEINFSENQLKLSSTKNLTEKKIQSYLKSKYKVTEITKEENLNKTSFKKLKQLFPLFLIITYILFSSILLNYNNLIINEFMLDFMGQFFIIFSFFKFLNLRGFKNSFKIYDPLAKKFNFYGWLYPIVETLLGISFLMRFEYQIFAYFSILILTPTTIGVIKVLNKGEEIKCACLGSILNVPMTEATLLENGLMILMSLALII
tara:strand:- start:6783 stop:7493 length:711 start_codon:yes stop_codon:yes gene_type:complete